MKKGVLLLIFLFILPIVSAQQEITIFGTSYSLLLVLPIFFMAVITLFFLGLMLKDNFPKLFHLRFPRLHAKKKHAESKLEPQKEINFAPKLYSLKIKANKLGEEASFNEFNELFKEFIKAKFNIKQEFTLPELSTLVSGHSKVINLADKIAKLKYAGVKITFQDITDLLKDFKEIIYNYTIKYEPIKLNLGEWLRLNIFKLFTRKTHEVAKPILIKKPKLEEIEKVSLLQRINNLFKKHVEVKTVKVKVKQKLPEAPSAPVLAEKIERKHVSIPFLRKLDYKLFSGIKKRHILKLIKHGRNILIKNPSLAKRFYARALLNYYKLPIKFEKDIANELSNFHNEILSYRGHEQSFLDISKSLIKLKHQGKHVSEKGVNLVNIMKSFFKKEELLASTKLKEFSKKLSNESRQLRYYAPKKVERVEQVELPSAKVEVKPEVKYIETRLERPKIIIEDYEEKKLKLLLKQPALPRLPRERHSIIKPVKRLTKNLKLLQKEKSQIYSKIINIEGHIPHHRLEHRLKAQ